MNRLTISLRSPLRPVVFGAALLAALPLAGTAAAQAALPGAPAGAVGLLTTPNKQVVGAKCAYIKKRWEPGQVVNKLYFISRKWEITTVRKTEKGKRAKAKIARLEKQLKTETKACGTKTPLRLSLKNVVAVSVTSAPIAGVKTSARTAQAKTVVNSNLAAMLPNGAIRDAILSGSISVADVSTAPNGDLYLAFGPPFGGQGTPVDVTDAAAPLLQAGNAVISDRRLCTIAKVDINTGVASCVDNFGKDNHCGWLRQRPEERFPIDVLRSGDVYYPGKQCNTPVSIPILTRARGGTEKFMTPEPGAGDPYRGMIKVSHYAAAEDGSVFVSVYSGEYTAGPGNDYKEAFYRITPDGAQEEVAPQAASFIQRFPDGNIYYALQGGFFTGVRRYISGSGFDPVPWFNQAHQPNLCFPDSQYQENRSFCSTNNGAAAYSGFGKTTNGFVFAAPGYRSGADGFSDAIPPVLYQYYPTLKRVPTAVEKVRIVAGADKKVLVTGVDASGANITTVIDPESGSERTLVGPGENIKINSLNYSKRSGKAMFVGTRLADGAQVAGTVDLNSGAPEIRPYTPTTFSSTLAAL